MGEILGASTTEGAMKKLLVGLFAVALVACGDNTIIETVVPDEPVPVSVSGSWSGAARWSGVQGGAATAVTSGAASANVIQTDASVLATWGVSGLYTGSFSGTIDPAGTIGGTATVTVLAVPCSATALMTGRGEEDGGLSVAVSFANPGTVACPGAPVDLVMTFSRVLR